MNEENKYLIEYVDSLDDAMDYLFRTDEKFRSACGALLTLLTLRIESNDGLALIESAYELIKNICYRASERIAEYEKRK